MKLNDIFERAIRLCGVGEEFLAENDLKDLKARALEAINAVLFDLCGYSGAQELTETADITGTACDAAVYGAAMFLSLAYGDTDKSSLFSDIYNQKRASVKSNIGKVADVLPETEAM